MADITPAQIEAKVKQREGVLSPLHARQDDDLNIWNLQEVVYEKHKTAINVTSNKPRTFADEVQTILAAAEMQIRVRVPEPEGEDKREDIGKLERLLHFALDKADERLRRLLLPPLRDSLIWHGNIRGWMAARILIRKSGDSVIFDFLPLDPRWVTWEVGANGLPWAAYKTFRSNIAIKEEYGIDLGKEETSIPVIDYFWGKPGLIKNITVADSRQLGKTRIFKIPSMPILIMPVGASPSVITESSTEIQSWGKSIFAAGRGAFKMYNRIASMVATHANLMAKQPTIHYHTDGIKPIKSTVYFAEGVLNLIKGKQELKESPVKEISPTVLTFLQLLAGEVEQATLPTLPIGSPPPSGTLYNLAQEQGKKVLDPQLRTCESFYIDICRLIEEQLIAGGINVNVKIEEGKKYYETKVRPVDLKKPHIIKVALTASTPWTQMDTYQVSKMAQQDGLPDEFRWEHILKLPDPKGIKDQAILEMAEHSPKLAMKRAVEVLQKRGGEGDDVAAESLIRDLDRMEAEEDMAAAPPPPEGEVNG